MSENNTHAMTAEQLRKAVAGTQDDLNRIRSLLTERQRKIERLDRSSLKEHVYAAQASGIREETNSRVNALLSDRQSFGVLEGIAKQREHWTTEAYLSRSALAQYAPEKESYLSRIVALLPRMTAETLNVLSAAAMERRDSALAGIAYLETSSRLSNPSTSDPERSRLLAAKVSLEATENYPEALAAEQTMLEAQQTSEALRESGRVAAGLSSGTGQGSKIDPRLFTAEQRAAYGIPEPVEA